MAKTKGQKQEIVRDLAAKLDRAKSVVFARFSGLKVTDNESLRGQLRTEDSEYYVAKKTLLNRVLADKGLDGFNARVEEGQMAAIFGYSDEVAPARVLSKFIKDHEEQVKFVGGMLEGKFLTAAEVKALADLPTKQELYAKLVGSINAPVSGFVNALAGNLRNLVGVLSAIQEKKAN